MDFKKEPRKKSRVGEKRYETRNVIYTKIFAERYVLLKEHCQILSLYMKLVVHDIRGIK